MKNGEQATEYEYFAFISYNREDEEYAKWLQKKLESYNIPSSVRKTNPSLPQKIRPIFRDQTDLTGGGSLSKEIEEGLANSRYLIVICSPRSARSPWVAKEVQSFIDRGRIDNIIPFIIEGKPYASNPEEECFPPSLRQLRDDQEILGININEMGREAAAIKVVSRMLGLKFDTLWQRHEKARRRKRLLGILITFVILFVAIGIIVHIANLNRNLANANEELTFANSKIKHQRDSINIAKEELSIAFDSIDNTKRQLEVAFAELEQSNSNLSEAMKNLTIERDRVRAESSEKTQNYLKYIAAEAIRNIGNRDVIDMVEELYKYTPEYDKKNKFNPDIEYALNLLTEENNQTITPISTFQPSHIPNTIITSKNPNSIIYQSQNKNIYIEDEHNNCTLIKSNISSYYVSNDHRYLGLLNQEGIYVYDKNVGELIMNVTSTFCDPEIKFLDCDHIIVYDTNCLGIYDIKTGIKLWSLPNVEYRHICISPTTIAVHQFDKINFYNVESGEKSDPSISIDGNIEKLSQLDSDKSRLLAVSRTGYLLIDTKTGKTVETYNNLYTPLFIDGYIYIFERGKNIYEKYDMTSGNLIHTYTIDTGRNNNLNDKRKIQLRGYTSDLMLFIATQNANGIMSLYNYKKDTYISTLSENMEKFKSFLLEYNSELWTLESNNKITRWNTGIVNSYNYLSDSASDINFSISPFSQYMIIGSYSQNKIILINNELKKINEFPIDSTLNYAYVNPVNNNFIVQSDKNTTYLIDPLNNSIKQIDNSLNIRKRIHIFDDGSFAILGYKNNALVKNVNGDDMFSIEFEDFGIANCKYKLNGQSKYLSWSYSNNKINIRDVNPDLLKFEYAFNNNILNAVWISNDDIMVQSGNEISLIKLSDPDYKKSVTIKDLDHVFADRRATHIITSTSKNEIEIFDKELNSLGTFMLGKEKLIAIDLGSERIALNCRYGDIYKIYVCDIHGITPIIYYQFDKPITLAHISGDDLFFGLFDGSIGTKHIPSHKETIDKVKKIIKVESHQ